MTKLTAAPANVAPALTDIVYMVVDPTGPSSATNQVQYQHMPFLQRVSFPTDNSIPRFDTTDGRVMQSSGVIIDDLDNVTGVSDLTATGTGSFGGTIKFSGTPQSLSGAGAISVATGITEFTSTGTGDALTLADGTQGQVKKIIYVAEGAGADTGVITPTNFGNGTTITLTDVGDSVTLIFSGTSWWLDGSWGTNVVVA